MNDIMDAAFKVCELRNKYSDRVDAIHENGWVGEKNEFMEPMFAAERAMWELIWAAYNGSELLKEKASDDNEVTSTQGEGQG